MSDFGILGGIRLGKGPCMDAFLLGISPFERPDPALVAALCRAGALGVLDLGRDPEVAAAALRELSRATRRFGVRVPDGADVDPAILPAGAEIVVTGEGVDPRRFPRRTVLAQVTSVDAARAALAAG